MLICTKRKVSEVRAGCSEEPTREGNADLRLAPGPLLTAERAESAPQPLRMPLSAKQHGGERGQRIRSAQHAAWHQGRPSGTTAAVATAAHPALDLKFVL